MHVKAHESQDVPPRFDPKALASAIADYDNAWAAYRAFGLSHVFAPSLYHDYYLCLGTSCNCAFDPQDSGDDGAGIGVTIDRLRNTSNCQSEGSSGSSVEA